MGVVIFVANKMEQLSHMLYLNYCLLFLILTYSPCWFSYHSLKVEFGNILLLFSSFQFSRSVVSDSLWPHESQHARPPCPTPTPRVYSKSRPWSRWCHPTISSSVIPFSSCPQSFPASGSFQMSQLFSSDGKNTGVSTSASELPVNIQDW